MFLHCYDVTEKLRTCLRIILSSCLQRCLLHYVLAVGIVKKGPPPFPTSDGTVVRLYKFRVKSDHGLHVPMYVPRGDDWRRAPWTTHAVTRFPQPRNRSAQTDERPGSEPKFPGERASLPRLPSAGSNASRVSSILVFLAADLGERGANDAQAERIGNEPRATGEEQLLLDRKV